MAVARTRGDDAQTVSDEHGKGVEVCRQQVVSWYDVSSDSSGITSAHQIMYCEVPIIIRWIRLMTVTVPDANADLTVYRNRAGTLTGLAATAAMDGYTTEIIQELALTVARDHLDIDDTVYALMVRDSNSEDLADWGIYFGWMPSIMDGDAIVRTY